MTPIEQYIRQAAYQRGINPDIAARVAGHEGMNVFDPSKPDHGGDGGSSFGPFQLHYGGINPAMPHAGMGDDFTKATGLDARDPSTWQKQVDFSLDHAKKRGWGNWMGAKAAGVGPWDGINMASGNVAAQPASPPQAPGTPAPAMGQPINVGMPPAQPMQQPQQAPQVAQNQPPQPSMTTAFNDFKSGDVKGGLSNVFGSLSGMAGSFDGGAAAPAPAAPLQGPSQQQMQALSQVLSGLGRRRNNQA
ncbi:hypothetical protein [Ochrobactrum sp. AN78]|uniref:hypothetical protein n=1 Tax=Ochrobactrum sp. AN78 TaxID=3039853 RepID=UPI002989E933|nr:hypothetical protein [Ochrobactrum sp. AN78]MDH7790737.1 hypothetical protein [Ochrobactrum sp. AN78]